MKSNRPDGARWTHVVGLVMIGAVVLVLVFMALRVARIEVPNSGETPGYNPSGIEGAQSQSAESLETEDADSTVGSATDTAASVPAPSRVLGLQDSNVAYRALTGTCPDAGVLLEVSTDGGVSWTSGDPAVASRVSSASVISMGPDGYVSILTQEISDCSESVLLQSNNFGAQLEPITGGAANVWHISPTDPTLVQVPQVGLVQLPCEGARIAGRDASSAAVLCSDTQLVTTVNNGASWEPSGQFPGGESLASTADAYLIAQTNAAACAGTLVSRWVSGEEAESTTCVGSAHPSGQVAIAATSSGVSWLWGGDEIWRSSDGGRVWQ